LASSIHEKVFPDHSNFSDHQTKHSRVWQQELWLSSDELLHLSVSEHLDCGFMQFLPFIGIISYWLFDYSLLEVRLFPTLPVLVF